MITPPNFGSGAGSCLPSIDVVAAGVPTAGAGAFLSGTEMVLSGGCSAAMIQAPVAMIASARKEKYRRWVDVKMFIA